MAEPGPAEVEAFFARPAVEVAPDLLGSRLTAGPVVVELTETEAYAGEADPASHAFRGPTRRNRVMFGPPARVYVYLSYGMHHCLNLVCAPAGTASAVLLRAGRVTAGIDEARRRRGDLAQHVLARGPGNLARALGVTLGDSGTSLWNGPLRWSPRDTPVDAEQGPRVGISRAAEAPWRWRVRGDPSVSSYRRSPRAAGSGGPR